MRKGIVWITSMALVVGGLALLAYAQQSSSGQSTQGSSSTMGPGMMGGTMGGGMYSQRMASIMHGNMMSSCRQVLQSDHPSPAALLAFQDQLKLTSQQVSKLRAIEQQASSRAEKVLNGSQLQQYQSLANSWGPQRMMQGRGGMTGGMMGPGMMGSGNSSTSQPTGGNQ